MTSTYVGSNSYAPHRRSWPRACSGMVANPGWKTLASAFWRSASNGGPTQVSERSSSDSEVGCVARDARGSSAKFTGGLGT